LAIVAIVATQRIETRERKILGTILHRKGRLPLRAAVNTTRLERSRQIRRLKTARHGHKLLSDKSDELFRTILQLNKTTRAMRAAVDAELGRILALFIEARVQMSAAEIKNAIATTRRAPVFTKSTKNVYGLVAPVLEITPHEETELPVFVTTHTSFDRAASGMENLIEKLLELGCAEKTFELMAAELVSLRRRISALEHSVIPAIRENIKYITLKLSENERGNLVRLMKVKEILKDKED
jgi:V/A-type H+-transporting ATPase subunit D